MSVPQSRPQSRQSGVGTTASPSPGSEELANLGSTLPEMSWSRTSLQEDLFQSVSFRRTKLIDLEKNSIQILNSTLILIFFFRKHGRKNACH